MAEWADMSEAERQAAMREIERQQFADQMSGAPQYPGFESLLDENGNMKSNYVVSAGNKGQFYGNINELNARNDAAKGRLNNQLSGIQLNKEALTELRKRGLATGPSAWADLATQKQGVEEATNRDRAAAQAASSKESAYSDLAASGGLSAGARERLARNSQRDLSSTRQDVARGGSSDRLNINLADEQQKLDILKSLPGMELDSLNPDFEKARMTTSQEASQNDAWRMLAESEAGRKQQLDEAQKQREMNAAQYNTGNAINQNTFKNAANIDKYGETMKQYAAFKQQKAMGQDEGKGGVKGGGKN